MLTPNLLTCLSLWLPQDCPRWAFSAAGLGAGPWTWAIWAREPKTNALLVEDFRSGQSPGPVLAAFPLVSVWRGQRATRVDKASCVTQGSARAAGPGPSRQMARQKRCQSLLSLGGKGNPSFLPELQHRAAFPGPERAGTPPGSLTVGRPCRKRGLESPPRVEPKPVGGGCAGGVAMPAHS